MMKKITLILLCAVCAMVANAGSGLFIRGGVNSWGATADWEFADQGNGVYTLENKELFGAFKVADATWSTYNYGSSGAAPALGQPYKLESGSNSNIDLGEKIYVCSKITLTLDGGGNATLLLEGSEKVAGEITEVFVMGNNNDWNFMDESGKLAQTGEKGVFKGDVEMIAAFDGEFCYWRIYEGLGQRGSWGFDAETDANTLSGTFVKGKEGCCTTLPGKYTVTFNINTGEFSLELAGGSVAGVAGAEVRVAGGCGEINVSGTDDVAVYTVGGALVSREADSKVPAGLYIVKAGGKVCKVAVK